jgi:hypothetical protein
MFVCLAVAAVINGRRSSQDDQGGYAGVYYGIAALMVLTLVVVSLVNWAVPWDHDVLVLEATEIVLFAVYWLVQTKHHWSAKPTTISAS